jgi:hypothetical protein
MCTVTILNMFSIPMSPHSRLQTPVPVSVCDEDVLALQHLLEVRYPAVIETIRTTGGVYDSFFLARWLKSKGGEVERAAASIVQHAAWRVSVLEQQTHRWRRIDSSGDGLGGEQIQQVKGVKAPPPPPPPPLPPPPPEMSDQDYNLPLTVCVQGMDSSSRPVLLFHIRPTTTARKPLPQNAKDIVVQLVVRALDSACRLWIHGSCDRSAEDPKDPKGSNPFHAVCCIFNMNGLKVGDLDLWVLRALFDTLQSQYPNILSRLYFVDAPFFFKGTWRCLSPFINPETKAKIMFVTGDAGRETLRQEVGCTVLPAELGGEGCSGSPDLISLQAAQMESDDVRGRWFHQAFILTGLLVLGILARMARVVYIP